MGTDLKSSGVFGLVRRKLILLVLMSGPGYLALANT